MTGRSQNPALGSAASICALSYRDSRVPADARDGEVILLAVRDREGLKLYASPRCMKVVQRADRRYIEELIKDLVERASATPDQVFEQLSNLSVGPLVTESVRGFEDAGAAIASLYPGFRLCPE